MKLGDLIASGLRKGGVIRETQNPTAEQNRDAIELFNGMMAEWDADGIVIGDFPVDEVDDDTAIDREYREAVKNLFAERLAIEHGVPVSADLRNLAEGGYQFLMRATRIAPRSIPALPRGRARWGSYDSQ